MEDSTETMDPTINDSPYNSTDTTTYEPSTTDLSQNLMDHAFYEFVIYMIPCFLFIIIALKRLGVLSNEAILTRGISKQPSLYIKKALSMLQVFIYAAQLIVASTQTPSVYWVTEFRSPSLVYLLAIFSWILSMRLLDKEVERGLPQKYFEHRMFWILNLVIACIKVSDPIEVSIFNQ